MSDRGDVPEPVAPGHRKWRRLAPWVMAGVIVAATLSCMGVLGIGGWAANRAFQVAKTARVTATITTCHLHLTNAHSVVIGPIQAVAMRDGVRGEVVGAQERLASGQSAVFPIDTSVPPYDLRVIYTGPGGVVVVDTGTTIDATQRGEHVVRLAPPNDPR